MRAILAGLAVIVIAACGPRQVEVGSGPVPATSEMSLTVTNNDAQAVNVYYVMGGTANFVGEVPARSTQTLSITGLASGSSVTLRAARKDGSRRYERNATLTGAYSWEIP
jgi:hypothetical protein